MKIARALAADRDRLVTLRQSGRADLKASPLCDTADYVKQVETLYRRLI